jgi:hypothetical protein
MVQQVQLLHQLNISAMNTSHTSLTVDAHLIQLHQLFLQGQVHK